MSPGRFQTQTERDAEGYIAKLRRRDPKTAADLAIPHEVTDPVTGVLQGPALREARNKRGTDERVAHNEERLDLLVDELLASRRFVRVFMLKVLAGVVAIVGAYLAGKHL